MNLPRRRCGLHARVAARIATCLAPSCQDDFSSRMPHPASLHSPRSLASAGPAMGLAHECRERQLRRDRVERPLPRWPINIASGTTRRDAARSSRPLQLTVSQRVVEREAPGAKAP